MSEIILYAIIVTLALMVFIGGGIVFLLTKERKPTGGTLAKYFADRILRGEVPAELANFVSAGSNCRNCGGTTRRPRWSMGDAHRHLSKKVLARALVEQRFCLICLGALAQLRRGTGASASAPVAIPVPTSAPAKKDGEKKNSSSWLRFPVKGALALGFAITAIFSANAFVSALAMPKLYLEEWGTFAIFYSFGLAMGGFILGVTALLLLRQLAK